MRALVADARFGLCVFSQATSGPLVTYVPSSLPMSLYVVSDGTVGSRATVAQSAAPLPADTIVAGGRNLAGTGWFAQAASPGGTITPSVVIAAGPMVVSATKPNPVNVRTRSGLTSGSVSVGPPAQPLAAYVTFLPGALFAELWIGVAHDTAVRTAIMERLAVHLP